MKNFLFPFLVLSVFLSCKSNKTQTSKDSVVITSISAPAESLIKEFKPIIQGVWVKADYIAEIAKTKSPLEAFAKASPITTMVIETELIKGDSILIAVGYGNHEGGSLIIKFRKGHANHSIIVCNTSGPMEDGYYELQYSVDKKDTVLTLNTIDKNKNVVESAKYFKAFNSQTGKELGYATNYMVNKVTLAGSYLLMDTLNKTSSIKFTSNGDVFGLSSFATYYINIDFTTPPGNNMDEIIFDVYSKKSKSYAYNFNADTLKLYETTYSKDSIDLVLGKLKYKLVRHR